MHCTHVKTQAKTSINKQKTLVYRATSMCWKQMLGILAVLLKTPNSNFKDTNIAAAQPPQLV